MANSVTDSYQVLLAPLPEGEQVITISAQGPNQPVPTTYQLRVAAAQILDPLASPVASPVS